MQHPVHTHTLWNAVWTHTFALAFYIKKNKHKMWNFCYNKTFKKNLPEYFHNKSIHYWVILEQDMLTYITYIYHDKMATGSLCVLSLLIVLTYRSYKHFKQIKKRCGWYPCRSDFEMISRSEIMKRIIVLFITQNHTVHRFNVCTRNIIQIENHEYVYIK